MGKKVKINCVDGKGRHRLEWGNTENVFTLGERPNEVVRVTDTRHLTN